ncbi:hypothetical protein TRVL_01301 [Trypanosoma vivax]|nr:hypothetical protein TRVL_01301 [Trypanosoma vivax]
MRVCPFLSVKLRPILQACPLFRFPSVLLPCGQTVAVLLPCVPCVMRLLDPFSLRALKLALPRLTYPITNWLTCSPFSLPNTGTHDVQHSNACLLYYVGHLTRFRVSAVHYWLNSNAPPHRRQRPAFPIPMPALWCPALARVSPELAVFPRFCLFSCSLSKRISTFVTRIRS